MNKRQRKKHRLGEFQELGFELRFYTPESWSEEEQYAFWDACIEQIEMLDLSVGGRAGICAADGTAPRSSAFLAPPAPPRSRTLA